MVRLELVSILLVLFVVCINTNAQTKPYDLTIGVMLPFDDPYLKQLMGYETSAGAVTLALDRIKRENLLPGANIK